MEPVSNKDIFTKFSYISNKITDEDKIRLLSTFHSIMDFPEKEFNILADKLDETSKKAAYNLEFLGINFGSNKKPARRPTHTKKMDAQTYKIKNKNLNYNFLRSEPKIVSVVESCSKYNLKTSEFIFIGEDLTKNQGFSHVNIYNKGSNSNFNAKFKEKSPNLILFALGGLGHNEISALEIAKEEGLIKHNLIIGSDFIMSPQEYVKQIQDLTSNNEAEEKEIINNSISIDAIELRVIR